MREIADFAVDALWQCGIIAAAALLALPLLRRASGQARHAVLVLALVACAVAPFVRWEPDAVPLPRTNDPGDFMEMRVAETPRPLANVVAVIYLALLLRSVVALALAVRRTMRLRPRTLSLVHVTDAVRAPITVGLFRPRILLPRTLPRELRRPILRRSA